ncbi:MAG: hypothetical protein Q4E99_00505, partial [Bacillota bacterium]|nr:hypothetical protein [Bacillota bacterium]
MGHISLKYLGSDDYPEIQGERRNRIGNNVTDFFYYVNSLLENYTQEDFAKAQAYFASFKTPVAEAISKTMLFCRVAIDRIKLTGGSFVLGQFDMFADNFPNMSTVKIGEDNVSLKEALNMFCQEQGFKRLSSEPCKLLAEFSQAVENIEQKNEVLSGINIEDKYNDVSEYNVKTLVFQVAEGEMFDYIEKNDISLGDITKVRKECSSEIEKNNLEIEEIKNKIEQTNQKRMEINSKIMSIQGQIEQINWDANKANEKIDSDAANFKKEYYEFTKKQLLMESAIEDSRKKAKEYEQKLFDNSSKSQYKEYGEGSYKEAKAELDNYVIKNKPFFENVAATERTLTAIHEIRTLYSAQGSWTSKNAASNFKELIAQAKLFNGN